MSQQLAEYEAWLAPAIAWVAPQLAETGWSDLRSGFLEQLGIAEAQLASQPAVQALIEHADAAHSGDDLHAVLLDAHGRAAILAPLLGGDDADVVAEGQTYEPQHQFVEGVGWMRYDATAGDWVPVEQSAAAPAAAETGDELAWVTSEQAGQLEDHYGADWRHMLTAQLAERWGDEWQEKPASNKQAWLDQLLPTLVMPFADVDIVAEFLGPAMSRLEEEDSAAFAEQFGVDPTLLAELLDEMPPEFYLEVLKDAAAQASGQPS